MIDRLVVLNDVSIARGGATALALESIRQLRAQQIPVTLITGDHGNNPELRDLGVEIIALNQALLLEAGMSKTFIRGLYNRRAAAVTGDWIKRNDTPKTIYNIHTWTKILSPSIFAALRPVSSRLVVSAHDFFLICPNGGYVHYGTGKPCKLRPLSLPCLFTPCDRRSYAHKLWRVGRQTIRDMLFDLRRTPPLILAIHDGMREPLERAGIPPAAINVLRNPVRPFTASRITAERNRELIFIGRLHPEKGPDIALAAARHAGAKIRVIGTGPMLETLRKTHPEAIFEGQKTRDEIAGIITSARALVMTSRYPEPFGLVAGEALWSGLPVILPETALMANEITTRGAGLAFPAIVETVIAEIFRLCLDHDETTRRMSLNAFNATRDLATTPETWIATLLAAYENLTKAEHEIQFSPAAHTDS